jgi:hypothetical protein
MGDHEAGDSVHAPILLAMIVVYTERQVNTTQTHVSSVNVCGSI